MRQSDAKKNIKWIQAWAEGKQIQLLDRETHKWTDLTCADFSLDPQCYRVKPEPRSPAKMFAVIHESSGAIINALVTREFAENYVSAQQVYLPADLLIVKLVEAP